MAELTDAQIDAAAGRGRIARSLEPRAAAARYDAQAYRIVADLTNGWTFAFPPLRKGWRKHRPRNSLRSKSLGQAMACIGKRWTPICPSPACSRASLASKLIWPVARGKPPRPPRRPPRGSKAPRAAVPARARAADFRGRRSVAGGSRWQFAAPRREISLRNFPPEKFSAQPRAFSGRSTASETANCTTPLTFPDRHKRELNR